MVRNRLAQLVEEKARSEGRAITQRDIEAESGVSLRTVNLYMTNQVNRFDGDTLAKFASWLECDPGDLLAANDDTEKEIAVQSATRTAM